MDARGLPDYPRSRYNRCMRTTGYCTTSEAAGRLGCEPKHVSWLLKRGHLTGRRWLRFWMIDRKSLLEWQNSGGPRKQASNDAARPQPRAAVVTVASAAERLGVRPAHVTHLLRRGGLLGEKWGNGWMVYESSVARYMKRDRRPKMGRPRASL